MEIIPGPGAFIPTMVAIVSGTNRLNARTVQICRHYANHLLQAHGEPSEIIDLAELPPEFISGHLRGHGTEQPEFRQLVERMAQADRVVWVFPEYNNSFPGVLKAFLDTFPFPNPLKGSVSAMVGISAGTNGGANAMSHWADILNYLGMVVVPQRVRIYAVNQHWQDGGFTNPVFDELILQQARQLMALSPMREEQA